MTENERDLRQGFAALRSEEASRAPTFRRVLAAARARPSRPRRLLPAAVGIALALVGSAVLLLRSPRPAPTPAPAVAGFSQWMAPTDFLLNTPGRELLHGVPGFTLGLPTAPVGAAALPRERKPSP